MQKQQLITEIERLEQRVDIYWELWGPSCTEVLELKAELYEANMQLLDLLAEEAA